MLLKTPFFAGLIPGVPPISIMLSMPVQVPVPPTNLRTDLDGTIVLLFSWDNRLLNL